MSPRKEYYIGLLKEYSQRNIVLILILASAALVWIWVFSSSASAFISNGERPFRASWGGTGHFDLFGSTIYFNFEGYIDYDYYYYTWGQQFLHGITPYSTIFDRSVVGTTYFNTPYFFPPLYVYMCAFGLVLPIDPFGIGFLITLFGFLTAFPVYGISAYLSNNRRVAEMSVLSYLLNPIILYYTVYKWLNPAPFVFFMMLSFYLLIHGRHTSGTLSMVTAALFKQIALFLILPLIVILVKRHSMTESGDAIDKKKSLCTEIDLRGLGKMSGIAAIFVFAVSFPYLLNLGNYLYYLFVKPGGILITDLTNLPDVTQPMSLASVLIFVGAPIELIDAVNKATYYGIFLTLSIIIILPFMLLKVNPENNLQKYWRSMIFLTLLLLLCVHIFSPRGVYKYYFVALVPFLSIQPVSSMISSKNQTIKASIFMILNPILLGLLIIIPNRYVYLIFVVIILLAYLANRAFSVVYELVDNRIQAFFLYLKIRLKVIEPDQPPANKANAILEP
jgi:hypothetical protein